MIDVSVVYKGSKVPRNIKNISDQFFKSSILRRQIPIRQFKYENFLFPTYVLPLKWYFFVIWQIENENELESKILNLSGGVFRMKFAEIGIFAYIRGGIQQRGVLRLKLAVCILSMLRIVNEYVVYKLEFRIDVVF